MTEIHDRLREIRRELGCTQAEMADRFQTIYKTYQRYEQGKNFPTMEFLLEIANKTKYNLHWLVTGDGEKITNFSSDSSDSFIRRIDSWIKEWESKEPKILDWFELEFKRNFPEFIDWEKARENSQTKE